MIQWMLWTAPFVGFYQGCNMSGRLGSETPYLLGTLITIVYSLLALVSHLLHSSLFAVFLIVPSLFLSLEVYALCVHGSVRYNRWRVNALDYNVDIIPNLLSFLITACFAAVI